MSRKATVHFYVTSLNTKGDRNTMKKAKYLVIAATVFVMVAVCTIIGVTTFADTDEHLIGKGIFIGPVEVSQMTEEQATQAVTEYVQQLKEKTVSIEVDQNTVQTTIGDLGYEVIDNDFVEEALKVGKSGNIIKRYKELKDIEKDKLVFDLQFQLDDEKVKELVSNELTQYDIPAVNSQVTRKGGTFAYTDHKTGRKVVEEETIEKIKSTILNNWNHEDITLSAIVIEDVPAVTKEVAQKCTTLIGTYTTAYKESGSNRVNNIANAAKLINGSVVNPGEIFSAYGKMNPFTTANGYQEAGAYLNGQVVDSVGGGVCQVSTTLYNAVLLAELEITERMPHSMVVDYVPPAMDAAISGTYKDLKFKNNTSAPIYVEVITQNKTITFNIYGYEEHPANRTIKYVSEVVETIQPGAEKVTKDPTLPTTYRKVTQKAHVGYKANLYKVVYVNGKETERTKINTSKYAAEPAYVTVGTKVVDEPTSGTPATEPTATAEPSGEVAPEEVTPQEVTP